MPVSVLGSHPRHSFIIPAVQCAALPTHACTHTNVMLSMSVRSQPLYRTAFMCFLLAALYSYILKSPQHKDGVSAQLGVTPVDRTNGPKLAGSKKKRTPRVHRSYMGAAKKNINMLLLFQYHECGAEHLARMTVQCGVISLHLLAHQKTYLLLWYLVFLTAKVGP